MTDVKPLAAGTRRGLSRETQLTLLLTLFSFVALGLPRVFTSTGAHTLFLETYGPRYLPYAYLAEALLVPLFGHLYIMTDERFGTRILLVGSMMVDIVMLGVIWAAFTFTKIKIVAFFGMVWFETEFVFVSLWLWGMATQLMTLRQGKRLFGYISSGEPLAVIIGGTLTPVLLKLVAPQYLLLLSASGVAVGIVLVLVITGRFKPVGASDDEEDGETGELAGAPKWYKERYVQVLVGIVIISQLAYFFTDSAFYLEAGARFPEEVDLGAFIGKTMAAVGVVSLVTSLFVSGPLVKRYGLRSALLLLPLMLATTAAAASVLGIGSGAGALVFWLVVAMKVIDQSVRYTVDKTSSVTLYAPLPAAQRGQVQAALESVIEPLVGGVSGSVLAVLVQGLGFGPVGVVAVVLVVTVIWAALVVVQDGYYQKALRMALQARRLGGAALSVSDPAAIAFVTQSLRSEDVGGVLNALELVGRVEGYDLKTAYRRLLEHSAPEVRAESLRRIAMLGVEGFPIEPVIAMLEGDRDVTVRAQAVRTVAELDPDHVIDRIEPYLSADEVPLRREAFVALLRHGGIEGILSAGEPLLAALRSADATDREFGATVLQRTASSGFQRAITALLADPEASVRAAALRAAGVSGGVAVLGKAARLLADDGAGVSRTAASILEHVGEPAIPALLHVLDDAAARPYARRAAAKVIGSIPGPAARAALLDRMAVPDRKIAQAVLLAIPMSVEENDSATLDRFSVALRSLLPRVFDAMTWRIALDDCPASIDAVLVRALDWQFEDDIRSIFRLLTLMYPAAHLGDAWRNFKRGDPAQKAIAMEALEVALKNEFRAPVLALLENETDLARLAALPAGTRPPEISLSAALERICQAPASDVTEWVRAAALYTRRRLRTSPPAVEAPVATTDPLCLELLEQHLGGSMLTIEKVLILRNTPIFASVREEHLVDVAQRAEPVELAADTVLFNKGDHGSSMYVVVEGRLRIYAGDRTFAVLGPREVVGEMAAVDPEARSASVSATEHTLLLRISNKNVELLIEHDPDVAMGIIKVLCGRLRQSNVKPAVEPAPVLEAAQ